MLQITLNDDRGYCNTISLNKKKLRRFTRVLPDVISITHACSIHSVERRRVEQFIETTFANSYQATVTEHYPILMSVRDANDTILAAVGFRSAQDNDLFLEQYLDQPIEQSLATHLPQPVLRHDIVEVGSLAATTRGASIFLFMTLTAWLEQQGYKTITVTATNSLQRFFSLLNIDFVQLGTADPKRLPHAGKQWGSYYQKKPRILAGSASKAQAQLRDRLQFYLMNDTDDTEDTSPLYSRLHHSCSLSPSPLCKIS